MSDILFNLEKLSKKHQNVQSSLKPETLCRVYHFLFNGDKINLYNAIFLIRDHLQQFDIDHIQLLRCIDYLLTSDLWLVEKITTIDKLLEEIHFSKEFYSESYKKELSQILHHFKFKGFINYFSMSFYYGGADPFYVKMSTTPFGVTTNFLVIFNTTS